MADLPVRPLDNADASVACDDWRCEPEARLAGDVTVSDRDRE